jgi:MFS family permease
MFVLYELSRAKRGASTLVEISLFRHSTFTKGLLLSAAFQVALGGILLALTFTLQQGLGFSALKAAIGTFVLILGVIPSVALVGQKLLPIMGRYVITLGSVVMAAGLGITAWALNHYGMGVTVWQLVPGLLLSGAGMGLISFPLFAVTLQHVDKGHVGSASGVLEAAQQLGSVFGVVIIGTLFFNHFGQGPGKAFVWALAGSLALLAVVCILSLTLPRTFKTEEELELVR